MSNNVFWGDFSNRRKREQHKRRRFPTLYSALLALFLELCKLALPQPSKAGRVQGTQPRPKLLQKTSTAWSRRREAGT